MDSVYTYDESCGTLVIYDTLTRCVKDSSVISDHSTIVYPHKIVVTRKEQSSYIYEVFFEYGAWFRETFSLNGNRSEKGTFTPDEFKALIAQYRQKSVDASQEGFETAKKLETCGTLLVVQSDGELRSYKVEKVIPDYLICVYADKIITMMATQKLFIREELLPDGTLSREYVYPHKSEKTSENKSPEEFQRRRKEHLRLVPNP